MSSSPILPETYQELLNVSLIKGIQATVAIEGNTLSEFEIEQIKKGIELPKSKKYQEQEVKNVLNALNSIRDEVVIDKKEMLITPELIKTFHKMIGTELGDFFKSIPGQYANSQRVVGNYKCPDYQDIPELIEKLCNWLVSEFRFNRNKEFSNVIIQAIVTHIYIEWIHPFSDGNGRTGRLLEFYILLRGGIPDIFAHILSNHYNQTRTEYYHHIKNSYNKSDITDFIKYALVGFIDGLEATLSKIQCNLHIILWKKYIHDIFSEKKSSSKVSKRLKAIAMDIKFDRSYSMNEITEISSKVAKLYSNLSKNTISLDIKKLLELGILKKIDSQLMANDSILKGYLPQKKE